MGHRLWDAAAATPPRGRRGPGRGRGRAAGPLWHARPWRPVGAAQAKVTKEWQLRAWPARSWDEAERKHDFPSSSKRRSEARPPPGAGAAAGRPGATGAVSSRDPSLRREDAATCPGLLHPPPGGRRFFWLFGLKKAEGPGSATPRPPLTLTLCVTRRLFRLRGEDGLPHFRPLFVPGPCFHPHVGLTHSVCHQEKQKPPEAQSLLFTPTAGWRGDGGPQAATQRATVPSGSAAAAAGAQAARPQRPRGPRERRWPARGESENTFPKSKA